MNSEESAQTLVRMMQERGGRILDLLTSADEEVIDEAFDAIVEDAVFQLESAKKLYVSLKEDGLSSVLAMAIRMPGIDVVREGYTNGHVDLTITLTNRSPIVKILAEAKLYDGPQYHLDGLTQLFARYMTGRERKGILVVYFRKENIKLFTENTRKRMDADRPFNQAGICTDHRLRFSFKSKHPHTCGETLSIDHIACDLFVSPE